MRGFIIVWLAAFGMVTIVASGVTWYVARIAPPPAPVSNRQAVSMDSEAMSAPPFVEADAVDMISARLPADAAGDQARQKLKAASTVTYHSPQHWRVCFDNACWVAHGPGRYTEPENEAAHQHEARTATPAP